MSNVDIRNQSEIPSVAPLSDEMLKAAGFSDARQSEPVTVSPPCVEGEKTKLTPRQNELISGTLCVMAQAGATKEALTAIRVALIEELKSVTFETIRPAIPSGLRSIDG